MLDAGRDRERLFRVAARHSRFVRFWRRAIPVTLIVVVATVAALAYFKPLHMLAKLPIDPTKLAVSGTKITMAAPRLGGFTRDGRAYDLTARAAAQDLTNPGVLELKDVQAHVEMQDKSVLKLQAAAGQYDTKIDALMLKKDIVLTSSTGYAAKLNEALFDMKKNTIVSEQPVEVRLSNGTVNANRLEVMDNGDLIRFDKGVEMNLVPQPAHETTASVPDAARKGQ